MTWKKLVDCANEDIVRGCLIKFNSEYPFEEKVVMMFCEVPRSLGKFGLITITGYKSGINPYFVFPDDVVEKGAIRDWLVQYWSGFALGSNIDEALIRECLSYDEL